GRRRELAELPWVIVDPNTGEEVQAAELPEHRATARLMPDGPARMTTGDRKQPSRVCRVSREHWLAQPWEATTFAVEEWASAWILLRMAAARYALPKRRVSYEGPDDWEAMQVGDVALLTDTELDVVNQVALVEDVWVGGGRPTVDLVLLDEV